MRKIILILILLIYSITTSLATTGHIIYSPTTYDIGEYGQIGVTLTDGDFVNYTYFIEQLNPSNIQTETGQIFADGSYINHADNPFNVAGVWTVNVFSCGYGNCAINKAILDNATATISGNTTSGDNLTVEFKVIGDGQFYVFKNGDLVSLATPGHSVNVVYYIGDAIGFVAYAYQNSVLVSVCDVPQTECLTDTSYAYTITGNGSIQMVATFIKTNMDMPVEFIPNNNGQVYIFQNMDLVGLATPGFNVTVNYRYGDQIGWQAYPYINETFIDVCDIPFTECTNISWGNYTVIGTLPDSLVFNFSKNRLSGFETYGADGTYDPNGTGIYSNVPNGSILDGLLKDDGLCISGACTASDIVEWTDRHILDLWLLTFMIVLYRLWSLKT